MTASQIEPARLAASLRTVDAINDPVVGAAPPVEMERWSPLWPDPDRFAAITLIAVTEQAARRVEEYFFKPATQKHGLPISPDSAAGLPVAIVFETAYNGHLHARIYSAHALTANRGPILPVDDNLVPDRGGDDILTRYFPVLHSAQMEATLDLWEPDGYLQHSNGETYRGRDRLRQDFTKFYATGGIRLRYCSKTDAGPITALEAYMPSGRPAAAIYERGPSNLVQAARLYL